MNINAILEEIVRKGSIYDEIINTIISPRLDLKPELISEIAISFLENKEKIEQVYKDKYFKYYFINTIRNQVHSNTSSFHKNVRINDYEFIDNYMLISDDEIENKIVFEQKLDKIEKAYSKTKKSWFENLMWEEYFEKFKSYRQIEKEWNIDHISVFHSVKKLKQRVRKNM